MIIFVNHFSHTAFFKNFESYASLYRADGISLLDQYGKHYIVGDGKVKINILKNCLINHIKNDII